MPKKSGKNGKRTRDLAPLPVIMVGDATELVSIRSLESEFQISRRAAIDFLTSLRVKPVFVGAHGYFSVQALDAALFYVTMIGGPGFAAPGSLIRDKRGRSIAANYAIALTDEDVTAMRSPAFQKLLAASAKRRGRTALSTLKKLVASSAENSDVLTADAIIAQTTHEATETADALDDLPEDSPLVDALLGDEVILDDGSITIDDEASDEA